MLAIFMIPSSPVVFITPMELNASSVKKGHCILVTRYTDRYCPFKFNNSVPDHLLVNWPLFAARQCYEMLYFEKIYYFYKNL